ncbi:TM1266 family iron-only hydrogenase system putative regulator [Petrotoga sp. 9PWA.NaAc.5.4]|uniref:TM1266 family iron-only hydrogenase system putative regulator n=1 Tax=Petrotoga sp. 9PWA.NaAc.5.4 TaxID=1434328 RepID=UPI000CBCBC5E|nr:TM1266 family iron-only hydrogenase system putative regulator [Petrotoga sp. 9PWA.NaAc.5.4]PNR95704.1 iron-only hydrogenase system regulator [Petrotoga sp. 9PWA.NaAc.5.4]
MEKRLTMISIAIKNREKVYNTVNELLHSFADNILLRVGYPRQDKNLSIIFLVFEGTTDELSSLNGKLGQIPDIKVKSHTI